MSVSRRERLFALAGLAVENVALVGGLVRVLAKGIAADRAAVVAAIRRPWSNGQTEGQSCRLKTLKRQMGGRPNVDLLKGPVPDVV
ncbi:MAG: hypothetical protein CVT86_05470, partial [Alphaproteobacteria bacterium HGW-Alphaproteobacteria-8]